MMQNISGCLVKQSGLCDLMIKNKEKYTDLHYCLHNFTKLSDWYVGVAVMVFLVEEHCPDLHTRSNEEDAYFS